MKCQRCLSGKEATCRVRSDVIDMKGATVTTSRDSSTLRREVGCLSKENRAPAAARKRHRHRKISSKENAAVSAVAYRCRRGFAVGLCRVSWLAGRSVVWIEDLTFLRREYIKRGEQKKPSERDLRQKSTPRRRGAFLVTVGACIFFGGDLPHQFQRKNHPFPVTPCYRKGPGD